MKRFKVEGWYRYNDEKDFERITICANTLNSAIEIFKGIYNYLIFYKINGNEIN